MLGAYWDLEVVFRQNAMQMFQRWDELETFQFEQKTVSLFEQMRGNSEGDLEGNDRKNWTQCVYFRACDVRLTLLSV